MFSNRAGGFRDYTKTSRDMSTERRDQPSPRYHAEQMDLFSHHQALSHASGSVSALARKAKSADDLSAWDGFSSAESETLAPEQSGFCRVTREHGGYCH